MPKRILNPKTTLKTLKKFRNRLFGPKMTNIKSQNCTKILIFMIISHLEVEDIAEKGSSNSQNKAYKILTPEKTLKNSVKPLFCVHIGQNVSINSVNKSRTFCLSWIFEL